MVSSICLVNGSAIPVASNGQTGVVVSASSTLTVQLANTAGVVNWDIFCSASDGINQHSSFATIEATKSVNYTSFTATFTMPAMDGYAGAALQFTSIVNVGQSWNTDTTTFGVFILCNNGNRLVFINENLETNLTYGVAPDLNEAIVQSGTGGGGGGGSGITSLTGDVSASGSGSVSAEVIGLLNKALPSLPVSDEYLHYTGSAFSFSALPTSLPPDGTAGGDLSGTYPNPTVVQAQGGDIIFNAASIEFLNTVASPTFFQGSIGSAAGQTLTIQSQQSTGLHNGGDLIINTGSGGNGTHGTLHLQVNAADKLKVSQSNITFPTLSTGIGHLDSSGNLTSSLLVDADVNAAAAIAVAKLASGSDAQMLLTHGSTPTWESMSGDGTLTDTGVLKITGLDGYTFAPLSDGYLYWDGSNLHWSVISGSGSPSGAAGGDLLGSNYPNPYVSAISGSGGAGGTVSLYADTLAWSSGSVASIDQTAAAAAVGNGGAGNTMQITAQAGQAAGGLNHNGGTGGILELVAGAGGAHTGSGVDGVGGQVIISSGSGSSAGSIVLAAGGSTALSVLGTKVVQIANLSTGVVHSDSSGNLTSSLITDADVSATASIAVSKLAGGSDGYFLVTDGSTPTWEAMSGDGYISDLGSLTVDGIQRLPITNSPSAGQFLVVRNPATSLSWLSTGGDITNDTTTAGNLYVHSLSYSSASSGGTITINGTGSALQWAAGNTAPSITQASTSSGNGSNFTIQAQNATGASHAGGNLILAGGTSGSSTDGYVQIQCGGVTQIGVGDAGDGYIQFYERINYNNHELTNIKTATYYGEYANGNSGTTFTVNWQNGNCQTLTLTGNCSLSFSAPSGACHVTLRLVQDGTGSRTVTWSSSPKWSGGTAPTLSTAASAVDIITFYYNGTNYYGAANLNFS